MTHVTHRFDKGVTQKTEIFLVKAKFAPLTQQPIVLRMNADFAYIPVFFFLISYNGLAPESETEVVKSTPVQEHSDFSRVFPSERRLMNWITYLINQSKETAAVLWLT